MSCIVLNHKQTISHRTWAESWKNIEWQSNISIYSKLLQDFVPTRSIYYAFQSFKCYCSPPLPPEVFLPRGVQVDPDTEVAWLETLWAAGTQLWLLWKSREREQPWMTHRWLCFWHHSEAPVGLKDRVEPHCIVCFSHKITVLGSSCQHWGCNPSITARKSIGIQIW